MFERVHREAGPTSEVQRRSPPTRSKQSRVRPGTISVQRKLVVGSSDDSMERDADRTADDVLSWISRIGAEPPVTPIGRPAARVRRTEAVAPGEIDVGRRGGEISAELEGKIRRARGHGERLESGTRTTMESAFGREFGGVRVHRDSEIASRISASAFTIGSDVHFAPGQYEPRTRSGQWLLGHELTHVVQQTGAKPSPSPDGRIRRGAVAARSQVLQRSPESQELMEKMAVPQTLQLQEGEVEVQDTIVTKLNTEIDEANTATAERVKDLGKQWQVLADKNSTDASVQEKMNELQQERSSLERTARNYGNVTYIGAIVLTDPVGDTKDLIAKAELIDLPPVGEKTAGVKHSLQFGTYHLVRKAGLEKLVILNTLTTMDKASQLAYLREAGLPNKEFAIVIEVHYYRSRGTGETKIHKDTRGETLFVNLNFPNKRQMLGPEYIVNPASTEIYDQFVKKKLPEVFVDDLNAVRNDLEGQKYIHATVIPENGIVAFVDEAIHHKTPTPEHRTATSENIAKRLQEVYGDEYDDAARAYRDYKGASKMSLWPWSTYLKNSKGNANADAWWTVMDKLESTKGPTSKPFDRNQLAQWLPKYFSPHIDLIVEQAATDFTSVGFSHVETGKILTVPVRQREDKPLRRRMSEEDLSRYKATASESGKRSFFRTWVRAVPQRQLQ